MILFLWFDYLSPFEDYDYWMSVLSLANSWIIYFACDCKFANILGSIVGCLFFYWFLLGSDRWLKRTSNNCLFDAWGMKQRSMENKKICHFSPRSLGKKVGDTGMGKLGWICRYAYKILKQWSYVNFFF